ncbi:MAG: DUF1800 domain-containing protein [Sphingobacteriales bacterium]|jgi:uncharacterized protein (DUF1800 family)|nr:DUF1800 domain-containing protein [Sphingobacteriales bacterium]MBP9140504.1 DUF1800 domain-containing protein [Chitinophagales bacterium]MDA0198972.1 DUF1800 domain-containing protein [Bacteroidota bacterium]MBK6891236.1 DUF1800 domain-containing protein [Sphingobacteriales bacterium]MBK7526935.1 DUF1800 domain-containing protein [Sphingobacteriales bacterium]
MILDFNLHEYRQQMLAKKVFDTSRRHIDKPELPQTDNNQTTAPSGKPRDIMSGLAPYTGDWKPTQVVHLLKRTMFGASSQHLNELLKLSPQEAVDTLLNLPSVNPPINNYNGLPINDEGTEFLADPYVTLGETWIDAPYTDDPYVVYGRYVSLKGWWIRQMRYQSLSIAEKMVLFWHNHFATQASEIFEPRATWRYLNTLRQHALGNFKKLTKAITLDPQMLFYLNGAQNIAGSPDENYARELQELFCVGKGPNSKYTENDVQNAARVLTGFTVTDFDLLTTTFIAFNHDKKDKTFSAFYKNTSIKGKLGNDGQYELDDLLDMIFDTDEAALFICRKLYRFFVYHEITPQTETDVIEPLAQILRDNDYEIAPVLSALFASEHFFDPLNFAAVIKSPIDFCIGLLREYEVALPDTTKYSADWTLGELINFVLALLMQEPGDPPNVAGWPAYYQEPQFDKYWINTNSFPRRIQVCDALIYTGINYYEEEKIQIDIVGITKQLSNPGDPNALIDETLMRMYIYNLTDEGKAQLKNILLSGQSNDYYWTTAWNYYIDNPTNSDAYLLIYYRLAEMYRRIMQLEEYQLM